MLIKLKVLSDKYGKNASDLKGKLLRSKLVQEGDFGKIDKAIALDEKKMQEVEKILLEKGYFKPVAAVKPTTLFDDELTVKPEKVKPKYTEKIVEVPVPVITETAHFGDALKDTAIDIFHILETYDSRMEMLRLVNTELQLKLNAALSDSNSVDVNELIEFVVVQIQEQIQIGNNIIEQLLSDTAINQNKLMNFFENLTAIVNQFKETELALVKMNSRYEKKKLQLFFDGKIKSLSSQHKLAKDRLISELNQQHELSSQKVREAYEKRIESLNKSIHNSELVVSEMKSASQKDYLIDMSDVIEKMNAKNIIFSTLLFSLSSIEGYLTGFLLGEGNMAIARGIAITSVGFFLSVYSRIEKAVKSDRKVRKVRMMTESEMFATFRFGVEDLKKIETGASRLDILFRKRDEFISEILNEKIYSDLLSVVNVFSIAITVFSVISMHTKFDVELPMSVGVGFLILIFSKLSMSNIK